MCAGRWRDDAAIHQKEARSSVFGLCHLANDLSNPDGSLALTNEVTSRVMCDMCDIT